MSESKIVKKKRVSPAKASILEANVIGTQEGLGFDAGSEEERFWSGDFLVKSDGLEQLVVNGNNGLEIISSEDGTVLDTFKVTKKNDEISMAVGDVYPDITGQEVVICHREATPSRLRIFSYDEGTGVATKELSFQPFSDLDRSSGCSDLQISDIDSDGTLDIVAINSSGSVIRVFSQAGDLEGTINFQFQGDVDLLHFDL